MMAQKSDEVRGHLGDVDREVVALGHAGLALVLTSSMRHPN